MTQQQKVIKHLESIGCKKLPSNSSKYLKFSSPKNPDTFYWVGKLGAVLKGPTIKDSYSITDFIKRVIQLKKGKNNVSTN